MSDKKRKTVDLPKEVLKAYQKQAIEQEKSIKKVLEDVLINGVKVGA